MFSGRLWCCVEYFGSTARVKCGDLYSVDFWFSSIGIAKG
jgi:hypothetical protein